jgi:hypothetical protein
LQYFKVRKSPDVPPLSAMWFYSFLKNYKDLQLLKPRKLNIAGAKCASAAAISKYWYK